MTQSPRLRTTPICRIFHGLWVKGPFPACPVNLEGGMAKQNPFSLGGTGPGAQGRWCENLFSHPRTTAIPSRETPWWAVPTLLTPFLFLAPSSLGGEPFFHLIFRSWRNAMVGGAHPTHYSLYFCSWCLRALAVNPFST